MLKQLSIYAENKKGALQTMTNALYEAGINIWGSVIAVPTIVTAAGSSVAIASVAGAIAVII